MSTCSSMVPPPEHFAKIGYKNHLHSVNNPYAQFQESYSLEDILSARMIYDPPLTKLQCSPTSDGSGAAILASEEFVDKHGLAEQAVEIVGQAMTTDYQNTFDGTCKALIGYHMNVAAAQSVYEQSALGPEDFQVIELHDCFFSANELLLYEALGLCAEGGGGQADRRRRHHVRRPVGGQPVRRAHLQRSSAGCNRLGPVRRTHLAIARRCRQAPSRRRHRRVAAQHRPRRRRRGHRVPARRALKQPNKSEQGELMGHIEATRHLDASPDAVFSVIGNFSDWDKWFSVHEKWLETPPSAPSAGSKLLAKIVMLGMANKIDWTVTEYQAPRVVALTGTGMAGVQCSFRFEVSPRRRWLHDIGQRRLRGRADQRCAGQGRGEGRDQAARSVAGSVAIPCHGGYLMPGPDSEFDDANVGLWTDPELFEVTAEKISEYARATNDPHRGAPER